MASGSLELLLVVGGVIFSILSSVQYGATCIDEWDDDVVALFGGSEAAVRA